MLTFYTGCCRCRGKKKYSYQDTSYEITISRKHIRCIVKMPICEKCAKVYMKQVDMADISLHAADLYRKQESLLTSEELKQARDNYNMTRKQFADFIGVTSALVEAWERGTKIQEKSQDELIRLKTDNSYMAQVMGHTQEVKYGEASQYTGFRSLNRGLLKNILVYVVQNVDTTKLFINKILFYIDFKHFKEHGLGITGAAYVPLEYGPCPDNYQTFFAELVDEGKFKEEGHYKYLALQEPDLSLLDLKERETILTVIDLAKADRGRTLFNLSHSESGFINTDVAKPINYHWAKSLKI